MVGADDLLDWQSCDVSDFKFACGADLAVPQHDAPLFRTVPHVQADVVFPDAILRCADAIVGSDGDLGAMETNDVRSMRSKSVKTMNFHWSMLRV